MPVINPAALVRHRFLALFFTAAALFMSFGAGVQRVEDWVYGELTRLLPAVNTPAEAVVVAIDSRALEAVGPWPWPRAAITGLLEKISTARPKTIGVQLPADTAVDYGGQFAQLRTALKGLGVNERLKLTGLVDHIDPFGDLDAVGGVRGSIVVDEPSRRSFSATQVEIRHASPVSVSGVEAWYWSRLLGPALAPPRTRLDSFTSSTEGIAAGVISESASGRSVRAHVVAEPLVDFTAGGYRATFALELISSALANLSELPTLIPRRGVQVHGIVFPTDLAGRFVPHPHSTSSGSSPVAVYSAADLLSGDLELEELQRKIVITGVTDPGIVGTFAGPAGVELAPVVWTAYAVNAMINGAAVTVPYWSFGMQRGVLLLLGLYLAFMPVRGRSSAGLWLSASIAVVLINVMVLLLLMRTLWLPLVTPALFVFVAHALLVFRQRIESSIEGVHQQAIDAYRQLAVHLQAQGQLDDAYSCLRKYPVNRALLEPLYALGLDFERRRQFGKAVRVYEDLAQFDAQYRDIQERRERLTQIPVGNSPGPVGLSNAATLMVSDPKIARPVLGRYQVERELGRGAMGMVYLGKDPKIGRTVAIKTLALSQEFDSQQLEEVRRRFHQEAETAGQLSHPNIVTIYDVGEEHDLVYIAMDYLEGKSLEAYARPDSLLPAVEVFEVLAQVADALDYAHTRKVVHRDVKPANIIYNRDSGAVKIMDFGIACLTDNSKTRTGTVLGSPFYMSPEQVAGKRVDGRSDLFSLGVTLYQLLSGGLPFEGESLATLMYKITSDKPKNLRQARSDLPKCGARIVGKALEKDPERRYQNGKAMAEAMRRCKEECR